MSTQSASATIVCSSCGAKNPALTEVCGECKGYIGGARMALSQLGSASNEGDASTKTQSQFAHNESAARPKFGWKTKAKDGKANAATSQTKQPAEEKPFQSSLGVGCASIFMANIITNVLMRIGVGIGIIQDEVSLIVTNVVLLAVIFAVILSNTNKDRKQKGLPPLEASGVATAIGIYILIQALLTPILLNVL